MEKSQKNLGNQGLLRCSTAGRDAPVDDHALPVGRFLDDDQSEAFREPDGGTRLGPSDVGALSDPCHRE
jgi:hypothetical protein